MGALVSVAQKAAVRDALAPRRTLTEVLFDGAARPLADADPERSCCVVPPLRGTRNLADSDAAHLVLDTEVSGSVVTLVPCVGLKHALALARRGEGSLVASVYGTDDGAMANAAALANHHGRVHMISPYVAATQTAHGNVMPQPLHGGPGRAGGGEEFGGLRALGFYHRRTAIQAGRGVLDALHLPV